MRRLIELQQLAALPVPPAALLAACVIIAASAALQGTIGFGFAVLSVPVMSLLDPALSPVPQLLLAMPLTLSVLWRERHAVDLRGMAWVVVGRLPGAALGVVLLKVADTRALDAALAVCVLLAVAMLASGAKLPRNTATELATGLTSGTFALVSSIGGPPVALLYSGARGPTVRASLAAIFAIGIVITVSARVAAHEIHHSDVVVALYLLPALFAGFYLSRFLKDRVDGRVLRNSILVIASIAGVGLLARGAWG